MRKLAIALTTLALTTPAVFAQPPEDAGQDEARQNQNEQNQNEQDQDQQNEDRALPNPPGSEQADDAAPAEDDAASGQNNRTTNRQAPADVQPPADPQGADQPRTFREQEPGAQPRDRSLQDRPRADRPRRDRSVQDRSLEGRSLDDQPRAESGERQFDDRRTFEGQPQDERMQHGQDHQAGGQTDDRQSRVQMISGRWWFQQDGGAWLVWDSQARQWRDFHPNVLEQSASIGFSGSVGQTYSDGAINSGSSGYYSSPGYYGGTSGYYSSPGYYGGSSGYYSPGYYGSGYRSGWGGHGYPDNRYYYYGNQGWGRGFDRGAARGGVIGSEIGGSIGGRSGAAIGGALGAEIGEDN